MDYKEKYEMALEGIQEILGSGEDSIKMSRLQLRLQGIFPELKESEDEKVRKSLIHLVHLYGDEFGMIDANTFVEEAIAWLEKQGQKDILEDAILDGNEDGLIAETIRYKHEKQSKQKLDKVEPKFKVGDWIINLRTGLIKHIKNVLLCDNNGNYEFESSSMSIDSVDNSFRLWTIQDAKDGDILYINNTASESIMIYKSFNNGLIKKYASYNKFGFEGEHYLTLNDGYITPATKEQRTELFLKMHEAGYEWDSEKKELKKIEQKPVWSEENKSIIEEVVSYLINYSNIVESKEDADRIEYLIDKIQDICLHQKQEWSEEDSIRLQRIIDFLWYNRKGDTDTIYQQEQDIDWLKSLRPQKCLIPSEEEIEKAAKEWDSKANFNPFYMTMEGGKPTGVRQRITTHKESFKAGVNWILKSLKPQNRWKPSDEQMEALDWQVENTSVSSWQYKATKELMEDLKKLKEE